MQAIQTSRYQGKTEQPLLVLTSPHGADAGTFLNAYPELYQNRQLREVWELFIQYLAIECDTGADSLAHALAVEVANRYQITTEIVQVCYPRGIIDGGRQLHLCLRDCLPLTLIADLKAEFLHLHSTMLRQLEGYYTLIHSQPRAVLLDLHTMASHCPIFAGPSPKASLSFESLASYVDGYMNAHHQGKPREIDLITADEEGHILADPALLASMEQTFLAYQLSFKHNDPYCAQSGFLSRQHLQNVPALSLDIPKHQLALYSPADARYRLDALALDPQKIAGLARVIGEALAESIGS